MQPGLNHTSFHETGVSNNGHPYDTFCAGGPTDNYKLPLDLNPTDPELTESILYVGDAAKSQGRDAYDAIHFAQKSFLLSVNPRFVNLDTSISGGWGKSDEHAKNSMLATTKSLVEKVVGDVFFHPVEYDHMANNTTSSGADWSYRIEGLRYGDFLISENEECPSLLDGQILGVARAGGSLDNGKAFILPVLETCYDDLKEAVDPGTVNTFYPW